jgi:hypothetical protein
LNFLRERSLGIAGNNGVITMNEQQSLWLLGWTVGGVLATAFVLNAIALAGI